MCILSFLFYKINGILTNTYFFGMQVLLAETLAMQPMALMLGRSF